MLSKFDWSKRIAQQLVFDGEINISAEFISEKVDQSFTFQEALLICKRQSRLNKTGTSNDLVSTTQSNKQANAQQEYVERIVWNESTEYLQKLWLLEPDIGRQNILTFLLNLQSGMSLTDSQFNLNLSDQLVAHCLTNYVTSGLERTLGYLGKKSCLSLEQQIAIACYSRTPGFKTIDHAHTYISNEMNVQISKRTVRQFLLYNLVYV